jgi:hypothetical protein
MRLGGGKEENLPVLLPTDVVFSGKGESPLTTSKTFMETTCPHCGGKQPEKRIPWILPGFLLVFPEIHRREKQREGMGPEKGGLLDAGRPVSAGWSTRFCICSMPDSLPSSSMISDTARLTSRSQTF